MNNTEGIEEALQERLSEIVNKDLSKRQVEKIVDLFASDKGNTITDEEIEKLAEAACKNKVQLDDLIYPSSAVQKIKKECWIEGYKANPLHTPQHLYLSLERDFHLLKMKSLGISTDQTFDQMINTLIYMAAGAKPALPVSDEDELWNDIEAGIKQACSIKGWNAKRESVYQKAMKAFQNLKGSVPVSDEEWISVEDRLPGNGQKVIVVQNPKTTATKDSLYAEYDAESKKFRSIGFSHDGIHLGIAFWADIILWQPLPKPPLPNKPNSK